MAQNNVFQGEMDPEIAALLGSETSSKTGEAAPDFNSLFNEHGIEEEPQADKLDLHAAGFPQVTKNLEDTPHKAFDDPNYYKTALTGEGDISQRIHGILQKYLNAKDPKDRGVFRQQFIPAYWEFLTSVARKVTGKIPDPKKYLLRFAMLHPTLLDKENRLLFSKIVVENTLNQPVYYLDEWFKAIGTGLIKNSATDEVSVARSNTNVKFLQLLEKAQGKLDGAKNLIKAKETEIQEMEKTFVNRTALITEHFPVEGLPDVSSCYTESQKRNFAEVQEILKSLIRADREQEIFLRDFYQAEEDVNNLKAKIEEGGGGIEVDVKAVDTEFETVKQMAKMTIGRQGNHFPLLSSEFFRCQANEIGYRENVISLLSWIESIDPEAFCRVYKNQTNRIAPYVVLIPSYGDTGMCWEPFDRHNRATSRGRIAIPMYPKNLHIAILSAVGDLRWQVAKERASYYWMEEGLTGNYYQWFQKMKFKGDLKDYFIQDYITWMTKESEGTQRLDKEIRGVFWRFMPFAQPVKEKLKGRSLVYQELYQRDVNRSMSDGY